MSDPNYRPMIGDPVRVVRCSSWEHLYCCDGVVSAIKPDGAIMVLGHWEIRGASEYPRDKRSMLVERGQYERRFPDD